LEKALQLIRSVEPSAPASSVTMRSVLARGWQITGSVYAAFAERERGELRDRDRESAREWYRRSMDEWRKLEPLQGFTALRRKEMESTAAELAALDDRSRGSQ
jgi:hypothetical protein